MKEACGLLGAMRRELELAEWEPVSCAWVQAVHGIPSSPGQAVEKIDPSLYVASMISMVLDRKMPISVMMKVSIGQTIENGNTPGRVFFGEQYIGEK